MRHTRTMAWYDALQVKVTKRLGYGLSGGLGYSWSKDLGTVSSMGTYTTAIPIQDPTLAPKSQKSYLAIDEPQMLNFYFNYEVPRTSFAQSGLWQGPHDQGRRETLAPRGFLQRLQSLGVSQPECWKSFRDSSV